jgi:hypothetical protein
VSYIVLLFEVQGKTPDRLPRATQVCYTGYAMVERERLLLPDAELSRPALVLAQRFVPRWELDARQLDDGSYVCVHEPLNVGHLFAHLQGEITLGAYLLDQENRARFIVLSADDAQSWERLCHLVIALADENVQAYLERSRRDGQRSPPPGGTTC